MKKILILGSNGFIGRNLKEYLKDKENYEVFAPSHKEFDIADETQVKREIGKCQYDVILHAAVFNPRVGKNNDASSEIEINLRMYFNFAKYNDCFAKMFYFGSGAEFNKQNDLQMVDESYDSSIPATNYGFYKYIINQDIRNRDNIYNLRLFGLFGKYENWRKTFISGACCKALKNLPITIRQNVYFDYLYIDDFCRIVEWFINNNEHYKDYNIASGQRIDLVTIAEIIKLVSKKDIPVYVCNPGFAKEYSACNKRLLSEIGFFEFTPMGSSIEKLYSWYAENESEIDIYSLLYQ